MSRPDATKEDLCTLGELGQAPLTQPCRWGSSGTPGRSDNDTFPGVRLEELFSPGPWALVSKAEVEMQTFSVHKRFLDSCKLFVNSQSSDKVDSYNFCQFFHSFM